MTERLSLDDHQWNELMRRSEAIDDIADPQEREAAINQWAVDVERERRRRLVMKMVNAWHAKPPAVRARLQEIQAEGVAQIMRWQAERRKKRERECPVARRLFCERRAGTEAQPRPRLAARTRSSIKTHAPPDGAGDSEPPGDPSPIFRRALCSIGRGRR